MVNKFKLNVDIVDKELGIIFTKGSELKISSTGGIEYVMDGCFKLFELDSVNGRLLGEVVERLW